MSPVVQFGLRSGSNFSSLFLLEWHGLDTLVVTAGVSALRPVLEIAGVGDGSAAAQPSVDGVQRVADVALAAIQGNYIGPLLSVVTMVRFRTIIVVALNSDLFLDPSHEKYKCLPFCPPGVIAWCCNTRTNPSDLRFQQGSVLYVVPGALHRTPFHQFLVYPPIHYRRKLPSVGGGWWAGTRSRAKSNRSQAWSGRRAMHSCSRRA